ncbi:MAG: ribonuclease D [Dongiaceae bacterium]
MSQDISQLSTSLIADSASLQNFIQSLKGAPFVTIDTEFLRDKTYWPQLCLVQIAGPESAAAIDTLAPGIDLAPLVELLNDQSILKVFHAARQDVEIFFRLSGKIPQPIVDTQVMAMVCGYGDAASYETLATKLANASIDKSSRFTDWARRPLSDRQLKYALSDVTYLRVVYEKLEHKLATSGRMEWVADEMAILTDPATYTLAPENSWQRLKIRSDKPRFLAVLREIAAWREREARERDIPRSRLIKDEQLLEIAAHPPRDADALAQCRGVTKGFAEGRMGDAILAAVSRAMELPEADSPRLPPRPDLPPGLGPLIDLLRVLLKTRCDQHEVAQKLIANADDLERIAADDNADVPALSGWRRKVFGEEALALKHGKLALTAAGKRVKIIPVPQPSQVQSDAAR